jgi:septum formation protein
MNVNRIVLASASPRRYELLRQIGITAEVLAANIDESMLTNEMANVCVNRLAQAKAAAVASMHPDAIVVAADTLISCENIVLGKPSNIEDALMIWHKLSNKTHQVFTGVAVFFQEYKLSIVNVSDVTFAEISDESMQAYWLTGEPIDKAGAYAIQGHAAAWIKEIRGSYSGIMGLPLFETAQLLKSLGVKTLL